MGALASERIAILGTIDPDNYAAGDQSSDWVDAGDFALIQVALLVGTLGTGSTLDAKLQQATSSAGGGAKDITGKSITQLTQTGSDSDKQAIINCLASELDAANQYRYVKLLVTETAASPAVNSDYAAVLLGLRARYQPADNFDLASVDEIVQ